MDGLLTEERAIRHVEPALASQLELSRLSNYILLRSLSRANSYTSTMALPARNQIDNRFFIVPWFVSRPHFVVASPWQSISSRKPIAFYIYLDSLEVVSAKRRSADCNHIFINFIYNLPVTYSDVLEAISWLHRTSRKRLCDYTSPDPRFDRVGDEEAMSSLSDALSKRCRVHRQFHGYQEIQTDKEHNPQVDR